MNKISILIILITFLISSFKQPTWGFFAHKRINRLAVFTLPPDMMPLFKKEIEYITEHAVDPDKRRYMVATEGYRHYINLDRWSFLPHDKIEAQILHTEIYVVDDKNDTLQLVDYQSIRKQKRDYFLKSKAIRKLFSRDSIAVADSFYRRFFINNLIKIELDEPLSIEPDSLKVLFKKEQLSMKNIKAAFAKDKLTQHGILPYHLQTVQKQLTDAFIKKDKNRILKLSAELGHYLADAHVPLHTISNYDGQLTNQTGIHAFWESRLPELFADNQYDFFVGRAEYINNTKEYFWNIVLESNKLVNKVLQIEKELNKSFPIDKKYCVETINGVAIQKPCFDYANAFHDKLSGMVEAQMRATILALGSAWYTAWVDAGQPNLEDLKVDETVLIDKKEVLKLDSLTQNGGKMIGRDEGADKN
jgi:hypothetical protein